MKMVSASERTRGISHGPLIVAARISTSFREGWKSVTIAECAKSISTGVTPPSEEPRYYGGDIEWFAPSDIGGIRWLNGSSKTITQVAISCKKARIFERGTLLVTCIGQLGRLGIAGKQCSSNQQITGIKFCDSIDPEFAYYSLLARRNELESAAPSTTIPILNQARLRRIGFYYPIIEDQKQISRFLSWYEDRLFAKMSGNYDKWPMLPNYLSNLPRLLLKVEELAARIEEARELRRRAVEETNALFKSGMNKLFTFHDHDTHPLSQLVTMKGGGTPPKSNPYYWDGAIPWISPKDMKKKEIMDSMDHISEIAAKESAAKLLDPGAVLIVVRGMILAKKVPSAVLKVPAAINQDMKALIPGKIITPEYLCGALWAFNSQILELVEKSTHDTRKLETSKLLDLRIPVPSPDEQRIIVSWLNNLQSKLNALQRHQSETAAELDALLPAVLERAFRGEL